MQGKGKVAKPTAKADRAKSRTAGSARRKTGPETVKAQQAQERLRPGQLDGLVLGYLKKHKRALPLTPTKVAHGIERSSGAVGNCLGRLEKERKVRLAIEKPRSYDLA